ncbi:class III poly(R)-hydroxyalkanoic acid synthase subunit PhaC [Xanthomonadaceae bacterium JHOS43]|nr:class III poly(R)-hydroxyalkanoic acid synthase subunit PhaC [Xanthomonadaceae bacterium JHOS43]
MIAPFSIDPTQWAQEALDVRRRLAVGPRTLREVGDVDFGCSPKDAVYRDDKLTLYRYANPNRRKDAVPLLICYALVNRPYMVDLQENRSLVRGLLARGEDVYLIDWGYPDRSDRYLDMEDYVERFLGGCVDFLRRTHDVDAINLIGICQGGVLSLCYSALHPDKVRNLITTVTPVDFHTPDNMLSRWVQQIDMDLMVDTLGNVPADQMNLCYLMLKPFRLNFQKYAGFIDTLEDAGQVEDFLRMEKWIFDSPDQAGEMLRQFVNQFYKGNGFVNGGIRVGPRAPTLRDVTMPVLNIFALQDHLVPPDASRALKDLVGTKDYSELAFKGGHIGIYVSSRAQHEVPTAICDWLSRR